MLRPFISLAIIGAVFLAGGLFFFTARNEFSQKTTSAPSKAASTPSPLVTEPTFSLPPEEDIYFGQGYNGQYTLTDVQTGETQAFLPEGYTIENQYSYSQFPTFLILSKNNDLFSYNLQNKTLKSVKTDPSVQFLRSDEDVHLYPSITEKDKFFIHIHTHDPPAIDESGMGLPPVLSSRSYFFDATQHALAQAPVLSDIDTMCAEYDSKNSRFFTWPCGEGIGTSLPLIAVSIDIGKHIEVISLEEFGLTKDDVGAVGVHRSNGLFFATDKGGTPKVVVLNPDKEVSVKDTYIVSEQVRPQIDYPYSVGISPEARTIIIGGSNNLLLMRFDENNNIFESKSLSDPEVYANFIFTYKGRMYYQGKDQLRVINLATWEVERSFSGNRGGEVTLFSL